MKTCKKFLAVLLSILMVLSCAAISASAEDAATADLRIESVKATKFAEGDKDTVLQLEMKVSSSDEGVAYDTLNKKDAIPVYEGMYTVASYYIAYYLGEINEDMSEAELEAYMQEVMAECQIASVKPVSFAEGVLTLDVFSKDGTAGAKMASFKVPFLDETFNWFGFSIPEGILKDSQSGKVNRAEFDSAGAMVEGLSVHTLELPYLANMIIAAIMTGNYESLLILLPLLPFLIIVVPILISSLVSRIEKAYNAVYDLDVSALLKKAVKALRQMLPYIIAELF